MKHAGSVNIQEILHKILNIISAGVATGGIFILVLEYGFNISERNTNLFYILSYIFAITLVFIFFLRLIFSSDKKKFIKKNCKDLILIFFLGVSLSLLKIQFLFPELSNFLKNTTYTLPSPISVIFCQIFIVIFVILRVPNLHKLILSFRLSPSSTVIVTFLVIVSIGTFLLLLPISTAPGKSTSLIDAIFTATSATCVTGLIVVDTGEHFSLFGQLTILILIQIGGLGLMTFTSFFVLLSGEFGVRDRLVLRDMVKYDNLSKIGHLIFSILILTFSFEAVGAVLLYFQFLPTIKDTLFTAYSAIFHSISAFCNAGFSIYSNSFINYQKDIGVNLVMSFLIIFGGLGFVVIVELSQVITSYIKRKKRHLSLHSKLVLLTTAILIVLGTLLFYLGEKDALLKNLPFGQKIMIAYFQSITARTAGFNTLPIDKITTFSAFLLIMLMFIGASPGSTGGGVKTSTFATLIFTVKSIAEGKTQVEAFRRTIPQTSVYQALCVIILALGWVGFSTLFLSFTEKSSFLKIFFEVFSAFGTVGLSRGLTPELTIWGKIIIIITMFTGRIGPLTLALAITEKKAIRRYEYPEERVIIG